MKTIYAALRNADDIEGRGPMVAIGYFIRKEDAVHAAKGRGVMGVGDGEVEEIKVFETRTEWDALSEDGLRKSALAKLTYEEKRVLGLT